MRDAVKESKYTLLVMPPAWMASEWTAFEALLGYLDDPAGKKRSVVPLLYQKCDIPEDIQIFTYIDLTREDREELAWSQIFTALGKPDAVLPSAPTPTGCPHTSPAATQSGICSQAG